MLSSIGPIIPSRAFASLAAGDAFTGYLDLVEMRWLVDDCVNGIYTIEQKQKYLPTNSYREHHPRLNQDFLERALFPGETKYALDTYKGLFAIGAPEVNLPGDGGMDFIIERAAVGGDSLKGVQLRLNAEQMQHGLRCMLLEVRRDATAPFFIQEYGADKFLRAHFTVIDGESTPDFILLDESHTEFSLETKRDEITGQYLVLGLDADGDYYQRLVLRDEYQALDVARPPQDGRTVYPVYHGRRMNRIPFVWCGAYSISGQELEPPPLLTMAQTEIALFKALADHAYHIYMNTQEILVISGAPSNFDPDQVDVGAGTLLAFHSPETKATYVSTNGTGFEAEQAQITQLKDDIDRKRMSLMSAKSHQSGTVISMIGAAQTAPLRAVVVNSGNALTMVLRLMAQWMGYGYEEQMDVRYVPSQQFASATVNISEYVSLCQAVRNGSVPMLEKQLYDMAREGGILSKTLPYERFKELYAIEREDYLRNQAVLPQTTGNPFYRRSYYWNGPAYGQYAYGQQQTAQSSPSATQSAK